MQFSVFDFMSLGWRKVSGSGKQPSSTWAWVTHNMEGETLNNGPLFLSLTVVFILGDIFCEHVFSFHLPALCGYIFQTIST